MITPTGVRPRGAPTYVVEHQGLQRVPLGVGLVLEFQDAGIIADIVMGSTLSTMIALAWTAPTASPPGNNVSSPINVSSTAQLKNGTLGVNALGVFGDTILSGSGTDGTPPAYLNFGAVSGSLRSLSEQQRYYHQASPIADHLYPELHRARDSTHYSETASVTLLPVFQEK
jgi:hypothetical protein